MMIKIIPLDSNEVVLFLIKRFINVIKYSYLKKQFRRDD